jgi:hypothetical protein
MKTDKNTTMPQASYTGAKMPFTHSCYGGMKTYLGVAFGIVLAAAFPSIAQDSFIRVTKGALTESYAEKLAKTPGEPVEPGEPKNPPTYDISITKKLTASASGKFFDAETGEPVALDIASFNGNTPVSFTIGSYYFSNQLGVSKR